MILMIDNYDSFTYNLVQYLGELGENLVVKRNDKVTVDEVRRMQPSSIVISPGPGRPVDAGVSLDLIRDLGAAIPILGVCLGHQCIGEAYGGKIVRASRLMHGKTSPIIHDGSGVFKGVASPCEATRYHSLVIEKESCPKGLLVNAWTADGTIMGVAHESYPVHGVQFHPESILTTTGKGLLRNFLDLAAVFSSKHGIKNA